MKRVAVVILVVIVCAALCYLAKRKQATGLNTAEHLPGAAEQPAVADAARRPSEKESVDADIAQQLDGLAVDSQRDNASVKQEALDGIFMRKLLDAVSAEIVPRNDLGGKEYTLSLKPELASAAEYSMRGFSVADAAHLDPLLGVRMNAMSAEIACAYPAGGLPDVIVDAIRTYASGGKEVPAPFGKKLSFSAGADKPDQPAVSKAAAAGSGNPFSGAMNFGDWPLPEGPVGANASWDSSGQPLSNSDPGSDGAVHAAGFFQVGDRLCMKLTAEQVREWEGPMATVFRPMKVHFVAYVDVENHLLVRQEATTEFEMADLTNASTAGDKAMRAGLGDSAADKVQEARKTMQERSTPKVKIPDLQAPTKIAYHTILQLKEVKATNQGR